MTSLSGIIHASSSTLSAYTTAIDVANTNISNVDTSGYARRAAVIQTATSGGASVTAITRSCDSFMESQIYTANQELGKWDAEQEILSSVEVIFNDAEDSGLNSALSDYWNACQDVANDPSSSTGRSVLVSRAESLVQTITDMDYDLKSAQQSVDGQIGSTLETINELSRQIADLNAAAISAEASGGDTNTLKDSRDSALSQLSELIDINVYQNSSGDTCVQTQGGVPLVEGASAWSLGMERNATTGLSDITLTGEDGQAEVVTSDCAGGELGGYLEMRNTIIPGYLGQLDDFTSVLITESNRIHEAGYDLYGNTGIPLFTGSDASDIAVSESIAEDSGLIAASSSADGVPSDGTNAASLANLQDTAVLKNETSTLDEFYANLVSTVGTAASYAQNKYESQSSVVLAYTNLRDSMSGVSTDEELANLIRYQYAYEAAAKLISTVDELLQAVIDM
jgi:flagellar hook-associated protein 1